MRTPEKLYEFHTENLRSVAEGLDNVFAAARWAIATQRKAADPTYVRLYAFLMGAWAECRLLKLLYEQKAFTDVERTRVLAEKALERWTRVVDIAFRRHYGIPTAKLAPPALPATAAVRHQLLNDVLTVDLQAVIRLRNKLAHGQWVYPLNDSLDDVAQEQMDALRTETILSLKQKAALVESLCAAVHDLVISKATFERDFDYHFRQIEQTRQPLDLTRLARGLGTQAMIDSDGDETRPARQGAAPARRQPHQRDRIGAAGNREDDRGRGLPVREQTFRVLRRDHGIVVVGHGVAGHSVFKRSMPSDLIRG